MAALTPLMLLQAPALTKMTMPSHGVAWARQQLQEQRMLLGCRARSLTRTPRGRDRDGPRSLVRSPPAEDESAKRRGKMGCARRMAMAQAPVWSREGQVGPGGGFRGG